MPSKRTPGQKLLPIPAKEEFIAELDAGVRAVGYPSRSQFIRDAVMEKLHRAGIEMARELTRPPQRIHPRGRKVVPNPKRSRRAARKTRARRKR